MNYLPPELIVHIIQFLDWNDYINFIKISKQMYSFNILTFKKFKSRNKI